MPGTAVTGGHNQSPHNGEVILTEDRLKKMLYSSFSRDSPEFEPIISLYVDQVKARANDTTPAETVSKYSGLYSELDLLNFVRLGPSVIGYPAASWENITEEDESIEDAVQSLSIDGQSARVGLKLRITRDTHPTLEDIHGDVVLKMVVVEEVNKKNLLGSLRAYLTPEGFVEIHTGSPGQKEGLEDYLQPLFKRMGTKVATNGLDLGTVMSAILGAPYGSNCSCPESGLCDEASCLEDKPLEAAEVASGPSRDRLPVSKEPKNSVTGATPSTTDPSPVVGCVGGKNATRGKSKKGKTVAAKVKHQQNTSDNLNNLTDVTAVKECQKSKRNKPPKQNVSTTVNKISKIGSSYNEEDENLPTSEDLKILQRLGTSLPSDESTAVIDSALNMLSLGHNDDDDDSGSNEEEYEADNENPLHTSRPAGVVEAETFLTLRDIGLEIINPYGGDAVLELLGKLPLKLSSKKVPNKSKTENKIGAANVALCDRQISPVKLDSVPKPMSCTEPSEETAGEEECTDVVSPSEETDSEEEFQSVSSLDDDAISNLNEEATSNLKSVETSDMSTLERLADAFLPVVEVDKNRANENKDKSQRKPIQKPVPQPPGNLPQPFPHGYAPVPAPGPQPHGYAPFPAPGPQPHGYAPVPAPGPQPPWSVPNPQLTAQHHFPPNRHLPRPMGPYNGFVGQPLIKAGQIFNVLVPIGNQRPNGPCVPSPQFNMDLFVNRPDEFGQYVAFALNGMDKGRRAAAIVLVDKALHQLNTGLPTNWLQLNPFSPPTRSPFDSRNQTTTTNNPNPAAPTIPPTDPPKKSKQPPKKPSLVHLAEQRLELLQYLKATKKASRKAREKFSASVDNSMAYTLLRKAIARPSLNLPKQKKKKNVKLEQIPLTNCSDDGLSTPPAKNPKTQAVEETQGKDS